MVLNKDSHPESLERLCMAALSAGDFESAFMYADRRCRILPYAKAHHHTLRAEALSRLQRRDDALSDIAEALQLAPEDIQANRRMLAWGSAAGRIAAATALTGTDSHPGTLRKAMMTLRKEKYRGTGQIHVFDNVIRGWVAWDGGKNPLLTIKGETSKTIQIAADENHPFADGAFSKAASFELPRPPSATAQTVALTLGNETLRSVRASAITSAQMSFDEDRTVAKRLAPADITVVVPIYRDFAATRACLESLLPEIAHRKACRVILVDDASPEPRIRKYLRDLSRKPNVVVLENKANLGFVGAINRALRLSERGDVILLNADTIVPPGFMERLRTAARAAPDIGTVTPLSNNGELTSFPQPFQQNPLLAPRQIAAIDKIASRVNDGVVVDIPNGIGFCLFITRECLDAVGRLSESFHRGYLEDVDYCLRAREHGFRNVCAASVYVGHHGSRSFKSDKRALVVRNLTTIETKFPRYRKECAIHMRADPLRAAREAIERAMPPPEACDRLIITGTGMTRAIAQARCDALSEKQKPALLLVVDRTSEDPVARVVDPAQGAPQSLTFRIGSAEACKDLLAYLRQAKFKRIEIADLRALPAHFAERLFDIGKPVDLFAADIEILGSPARSGHGSGDEHRYWRAAAKRFDRIVAPCPQAKAFLHAALPGASISLSGTAKEQHAKKRASPAREGEQRIGMIALGQSAEEFKTIQVLSRAFVRQRPDIAFIVIGTTLDDFALMATGNVFVSGPVEKADYGPVLEQYRPDKLFVAMRRPLFGHPATTAARQNGAPIAYFDWSFGKAKARKADLPIDPRADDAKLVSLMSNWVTGVS